MAEKRIYELTLADKLDPESYIVQDKSGNASAEKVPVSAITDQFADISNVYGAKNMIKYPYYETTKTLNGVTFTDNGDGTITVNGTATGETRFYMVQTTQSYNCLEPGKTYKLSNSFATASNSTRVEVALYNGATFTGAVWLVGVNKEITFTVPTNVTFDRITVYILMLAGETFSNQVFKPMLRLASIEDDTWVPYAPTNAQLNSALSDSGTIKLNNSYNIWYRKVGKLVTMWAQVNTGSPITILQIGTLPSEYRPPSAVGEISQIESVQGLNRLSIRQSDGLVRIIYVGSGGSGYCYCTLSYYVD